MLLDYSQALANIIVPRQSIVGLVLVLLIHISIYLLSSIYILTVGLVANLQNYYVI